MRSSASFNPATLELIRGITVYHDFHEHAHLAQATRRTPAWRLRERFTRQPRLRWCGLGALVNCAVELEAVTMARAEMKACGIWLESDAREAAQGLISYVIQMVTEF